MNEKGLVANLLYLAESQYGTPNAAKPALSIALWAQYALDNFATVDEAVEALQKEPFTVIAPTLPNGAKAQLHLALSDPTGDSAIFEYLDGFCRLSGCGIGAAEGEFDVGTNRHTDFFQQGCGFGCLSFKE